MFSRGLLQDRDGPERLAVEHQFGRPSVLVVDDRSLAVRAVEQERQRVQLVCEERVQCLGRGRGLVVREARTRAVEDRVLHAASFTEPILTRANGGEIRLTVTL